MTLTQPFLAPAEMRLLEPLRFAPRRTFSGRVRGERLSRQKGVSLEFADFRDYTDGDDLRHLDWSVLARLERPTIRTYQDEDDLAVYVALDTSASMDFGDAATGTKFEHAARLAVALGFVGLMGQDAVQMIALGGGGRAEPSRAFRGRAAYRPLTLWTGNQTPTGDRGLAQTLTRFAQTARARPGLFVLVSDGLDPDAPNALRAIGARGHELIFIQTLSEIDLNPDMDGDLRLLDAETGAPVEVTAHAETLRTYRANLDAHNKKLEAETLRVGGRFVRTVAGQPLAELVTHELRRAGVVR